jgi:folate-binding protein YgfZ
MDQVQLERHQAGGARWGDREGRERLMDFGSFEEEYSALDGGCALFDLSDRGLFSVRGEDRVRFLNGLLTNDVARLSAGSGCHACQLNRQSKVLSDLRIYAFPERFLVETEPGFEMEALSHLRRYKIADRVEFEPLSDSSVRFSLQGPGTSRVLRSLLGTAAAEAASQMGPHDHLDVGEGGSVLLLRAPRTGREGVDLVAPANSGFGLWEDLRGAGAAPAGWLALEAGRIEAGLPRFGTDFGPENLFMEVGLTDAVSFDKGCYVGQEIVARVRSRGHVNKRLAVLTIEGDAAPGDLVRVGEAVVGRLTSASRSPRLGFTVALALLGRETAEAEGAPCQVGETEPFGRARVARRPVLPELQP